MISLTFSTMMSYIQILDINQIIPIDQTFWGILRLISKCFPQWQCFLRFTFWKRKKKCLVKKFQRSDKFLVVLFLLTLLHHALSISSSFFLSSSFSLRFFHSHYLDGVPKSIWTKPFVWSTSRHQAIKDALGFDELSRANRAGWTAEEAV